MGTCLPCPAICWAARHERPRALPREEVPPLTAPLAAFQAPSNFPESMSTHAHSNPTPNTCHSNHGQADERPKQDVVFTVDQVCACERVQRGVVRPWRWPRSHRLAADQRVRLKRVRVFALEREKERDGERQGEQSCGMGRGKGRRGGWGGAVCGAMTWAFFAGAMASATGLLAGRLAKVLAVVGRGQPAPLLFHSLRVCCVSGPSNRRKRIARQGDRAVGTIRRDSARTAERAVCNVFKVQRRPHPPENVKLGFLM